MPETTPRFALPLLATGQAQKEVTHNEALTLADLLLAPVVQSVAPALVPSSPVPGQGWVVGSAPSGVWVGQAENLAFWTGGGWRFAIAPAGMTLWSVADTAPVRRTSSGWEIGQLDAFAVRIGGNQVLAARQPVVPSITGGTVIDMEARAGIAAILNRLRTHGLIAT